jgi:hypothetical protein
VSGGFRVTKYDPRLRDPRGGYTRIEWTSAHEIGSPVGGHVLTADEYLGVERGYVDVLLALWADAGEPALVARAVERGAPPPEALPVETASLTEAMRVDRAALPGVLRALLRSQAWARLEGGGFAILPYFDLYVFVRGVGPSAHTRALAAERHIFVERAELPWPQDV